MKEIQLGKAEDLEMLQAVKARYIKASWRSYNNIYLLDRFLEEGSGPRAVYLEEADGGVACLVDRGTHYQLLCSLPLEGAYRLPELDKEICCEFIAYSDDCKGEQTELYRAFLSSQGFRPVCVFQELKYCTGQLHPIAQMALPGEIARLKGLGMSLEPARPDSKAEIETLVSSEIGKYDGISYDQTEWRRQIANGNATAIYCGEVLAAADLFRANGSRYVVKPAYRGKHLGYVIKTAFLGEERWKNTKQWYREWVAVENEASLKTLLALGYHQTNRLKYRWLRYPKGEGLE